MELKGITESPSLPKQLSKKVKVSTKFWKNTKKESALEIDKEADETKTYIGNWILESEVEANGTFNESNSDTC